MTYCWYNRIVKNSTPKFCTFEDLGCVSDTLGEFSATGCGCLPDCNGTQFSIFQSRESFENVGQICRFKNTKYPSSLLCALCTQLTRNFKARLLYESIVNGGPDPADRAAICDKIIKENIALVKVEMAAKSLTR